MITSTRRDTASTLTHRQLAFVTAGRLALNIAYRMLYPLLPFLALRFDVSLQTVSMLVSVQVAASLSSLVGGRLADTRGHRATMSGGLALFCVGAMLCALSSTFPLFLIGYGLIGLSAALYQPAAQAYLSARTPYTRRGWALGIFETSWAFAALFGIAPLMYVVQATGDSTPIFWILLGAGIVSFVMIRYALPPAALPDGVAQRRLDWKALRRPSVLAMLGLLSLSMAAVDLIFVVQGAWLKTNFGANEAQLGQVFGMLGIAELVGAIGATMLADRFGKKRAVIGGFLATAFCLAAIPWSDGNWMLFLPLFFLFDVCFEFAVVSASPLASGIAPTLRSTIMALCVAANGFGRLSGSLISEPLWRNYGITTNSLLAAALMCVGVALCARFTRETEQ